MTDTVTSLIWQQPAATSVYISADAKSYCAGLSLGGLTAGSWRLPTVIELLSLVDDTRYDPSINPTAFPNTLAGPTWSSSPNVNSAGSVWVVDFGNGYSYSLGVTSGGCVRCVH